MDVTINGARLNIEVLGGENTDKPVMIVHHGAPGLGSHAEPKGSFGKFSDDFRVVVFDARGSGASEDLAPFTHDQWAADVEAIREWIDAEQIIMAGGSYGGFISMEYAIRYPNRVLAMVLRDTSPDNSHRELSRANALASPRIEVDLELFNRIMAGTTRDNADLKAAWGHILPLYDHDLDMDKVKSRTENTPYHFETHNYAFAVNQENYDLKDKLPGITAPTLITVGRHDWITPVSASETIHRLIPGSELVIFENSGHSPQVEEADKFEATVRDFLKRALARS
ncbi:hydrolase [Devosia epidermidihirudinis]|uniref:Hydrolase n=1 Tax=Devosia epidermidihirudinis TaxID=1293439 RepID=A0A0F5QAU1_9HYPH|nr:alpha/beta hydrolase [Devosia epidermidihirudinis]KKC38107.1 hydrolase [Devosia epidermidihirudinis]